MEKIRIGVLGCANIGKRSVIPAIQHWSDKFELVAVASRTKAKAEEFAAMFNCEAIEGYQNIIDRTDIDALYLPLPTGLHEEWIIKGLESKKHILSEKSLAVNLESTVKIIKAAKDNNRLIMEDFMFTYHSQHNFIKEKLKEGRIGELRLFQSRFGFPPFPDGNFRYSKTLGGGALLDAGAYTIKSSQLFLGRDLEVQSAVLYFKNEVDIGGNATLINSKGQVSQIAFGFDNYYQCEYEVWGSKGKIIAKKAFTPKAYEAPLLIIENQNIEERLLLQPNNHFFNIISEFHSVIIKGEYEDKYEELIAQSRIITDVQNKAKKITI